MRRIGVLGHDLFLYPELTARENLVFFAGLYGVRDRRGAAAEALEHAGLADRADDPVSSFSRGMRQRVALERALIHRPRLLLLDEPFTGLDDASAAALGRRLQCAARARAPSSSSRRTISTSRKALLDRAVFLRDGRDGRRGGAARRAAAVYRDVMAPRPRSPASDSPASAARGRTVMFARIVWLVLRKDLTVEVRSLEIAYTTLFFAVSCVLVFAFALVQEGRAPEGGAAGILWIADRVCRHSGAWPDLRARAAVGNAAGAASGAGGRGRRSTSASCSASSRCSLAAEMLLVPLVALLFQAPLLAHPFWLALILVAGTIGFAAVGTLFAAMLVRAAESGRAPARAVVSDHCSGHHCRCSRDGGAAAARARRRHRPLLAGAARVLRRGLRHAGALDVRAAHDGLSYG